MKIMITGGSGLIGSALADAYQKQGHQVVIVSRSPGPTKNSIRTITWDQDELRSELRETEAVIHLAGASIGGTGLIPSRWTDIRKKQIIQSRLDTGALLTEAIRQSSPKPKVLVQASAIGYYGNLGAEPVDESSPLGSDFLADVCRQWEESSQKVESDGVRRIIARIGLVLSQDGGLYPLLSFPYKFFLGGRIGDGNQFLSWIHMADLIRSIQHLVEDHSAQGSFNLTAPSPVNQETFGKTLAAVLKRPHWFPVPAGLLKLVLGEAATLALDGREVYPVRLLKTGFVYNYPNLKSALDNINEEQ